MNLIQMAYTDNHQNFKLGKILQSMTDSPEFNLFCAYVLVISTDI